MLTVRSRVQTSAPTRDQVLQLVDLHGDVVGTVPIGEGAEPPSWQELTYASYDEFGAPQPLSGGQTANAPPRYGWLGAAQRSADTPTGVVLMGVRLYHPGVGRFLQVDPVAGGSASAYDYCNADPVNCTDLGGTIAWGKVLGVVATVGEIASFIPGPIGAAAAGVSAVAYAASGNKGKALEMGITAAAQLVGAGIGVRAAFRATSLGAKATQRAQAVTSRVRGALKRGCSFVAGTLVRMANGSLTPIEDLQPGDLILTGDPETGQTSPEPVITPLTSTGDKRLIALRFDGDAQAVVATDNHPYWVQYQGWVAAGDLLVGDTTLASDGTERVLTQTTDLGVFLHQTVHNLHVAGQHTYYVTANPEQADQLVHNASPISCPVSMIGSRGTTTASTSVLKQGPKRPYRIDVENPNPGSRPGQMHLQHGGKKYQWDFGSRQFSGAPRSLIRQVERDKGYKGAIKKGYRYLGMPF